MIIKICVIDFAVSDTIIIAGKKKRASLFEFFEVFFTDIIKIYLFLDYLIKEITDTLITAIECSTNFILPFSFDFAKILSII